MAGYELAFDRSRGLLTCRIDDAFAERDGYGLRQDLAVAAAKARVAGPLRLLWDNRAGRDIPPDVAETIRALLMDRADPADRVAILVSNSLAKGRSRRAMSGRSEVFASENAALTWLNVPPS